MRFQLATVMTTLYAIAAGVSAVQFDSVALSQRDALYERWLDTQAAEVVERSLERRVHKGKGPQPLVTQIERNLHKILAGYVLHVNGGDCEAINGATKIGPGEWSVRCRNGHNVIISATGNWRWERGAFMPMPPQWI